MSYRKGEAAIYAAQHTSTCTEGRCLQWVRGYYNIGPKFPSAIESWKDTPLRYRHGSAHAARGYPFYWSGGSQGYGHIALGIDADHVISTDWPWAGHVGVAAIRDISTRWYMTPLGYATWLNGVRIWVPTVDASKLRYAADGHPSGYKYGTARVEYRLWKHNFLAWRYVNGYWAPVATGGAWAKACNWMDEPVSRVPNITTLRHFARHTPQMIVVG
jgi:hypothetical protein